MDNFSESFPNFLVIGAGKSGTTSLNHYLEKHPEIFMCPVKEPNFFAYKKHSVEDFDLPEDRLHYKNSITDIEKYIKIFSNSEGYKVRGEVSNTYLYGKYSIETIKKYVPNSKFIAILRQPAERLYSRYLHLARENKLPSNSFSDVFDKRSIWWRRPDLVNEGFYFKHLNRFYLNFSSDHIKTYLYDDLKNDPSSLLNDIFLFLGVDPNFEPKNLDIIYNKSGFIKNSFIHKLIGPNSYVLRTIKSISPKIFSMAKKNQLINQKLIGLRSLNLVRPKLSLEMKKRITEEIYLDDILKLEKLTKLDLQHWYNF